MLALRKGRLGKAERTTTRRYGHAWQEKAAAEEVTAKLREDGFTRRRSCIA